MRKLELAISLTGLYEYACANCNSSYKATLIDDLCGHVTQVFNIY